MPLTVPSFSGKYAFLDLAFRSGSQFDGDVYQSAIAAFMAARIVHRADRVSFVDWNCRPWEARWLGKSIPPYWIRPDWAEIEEAVMLEIQRSKFSWPVLREKLLATGEMPIVYGNAYHDRKWGVCYCERCAGAGENRLGKMLEQVRQECRAGLLDVPLAERGVPRRQVECAGAVAAA
jgi:predicted NAD-dependent protein-ADP-ribosyltransferase YbiA (DUF1768 family)